MHYTTSAIAAEGYRGLVVFWNECVNCWKVVVFGARTSNFLARDCLHLGGVSCFFPRVTDQARYDLLKFP